MENNEVQENAVPTTDEEKEKSLQEISSLSQKIIDSYKSIKVVGVLGVIAAFAYAFAAMAGFHGPLIFPVLIFVIVGNQIYVARTIHKEKKLVAMKNAYESKFGVVAP